MLCRTQSTIFPFRRGSQITSARSTPSSRDPSSAEAFARSRHVEEITWPRAICTRTRITPSVPRPPDKRQPSSRTPDVRTGRWRATHGATAPRFMYVREGPSPAQWRVLLHIVVVAARTSVRAAADAAAAAADNGDENNVPSPRAPTPLSSVVRTRAHICIQYV